MLAPIFRSHGSLWLGVLRSPKISKLLPSLFQFRSVKLCWYMLFSDLVRGAAWWRTGVSTAWSVSGTSSLVTWSGDWPASTCSTPHVSTTGSSITGAYFRTIHKKDPVEEYLHLPISCSLAVMHYSLLPKTYSIALKCILCVFLLDP